MKNKRGVSNFEMLMWIPRIIFIVFIMFVIIFLVRTYVATVIDTSAIKANLFSNRVIYSANGISYYDESIKRTYPGIIDPNKFSSADFLDKAIYYGAKNREIGAKIVLKDLNEGKESVLFYNQPFFKEQKKLVDSGLTEGPGGARGYTKKYNVLIMMDSLDKGELTIDIVIPNS